MNKNVYLALGSNIEDRLENLRMAIEKISIIEGTALKKVSKIYETDPVGYEDQDRFLNMAVEIETELGPSQLLKKLQQIELDLKRKRDIRWGPRTIDIDILLFDKVEMEDEELCIPHKRMWERAFVLMPLSDILDGSIKEKDELEKLISACSDFEGVKPYGGAI